MCGPLYPARHALGLRRQVCKAGDA